MFKVYVNHYSVDGHRGLMFNCDLIDHDQTGDIRLYKYTDISENPDLSKVKLVYKFESHVEFISEIFWEEG